MKNRAFIKKWKSWYQRFSVLIRATPMVAPVFSRRYLVQYSFCAYLLFLRTCTDTKRFINMELGPHAKEPEILKVLPTAEGPGKSVTGGHGGKVVMVTNTNDDGDGFFRWTLQRYSQNEATTVVFTVSSKVELKSEVRCKVKNSMLAEQTAPGDGVCIIKNEINFGGSENPIIRHMRFRAGEKDASGKEHNAVCLQVENANNFIISHCSFSWASEENTSFIDTHLSTVQWCISSEGLYYSVNKKGARAYDDAWGGTSSTHRHNLFAHCNSRTPLMNGARGKDPG